MLCSGLFSEQIHNSTLPNYKRKLRSEVLNTYNSPLLVECANGRGNTLTVRHNYDIITSSQGMLFSHDSDVE
jgi:hypothetical protein